MRSRGRGERGTDGLLPRIRPVRRSRLGAAPAGETRAGRAEERRVVSEHAAFVNNEG